MMRLLSVAMCLLAVGLAEGENLFPDPGFEQSGESGAAHSGARAGYLSIAGKTHWRAIGGAFPVEPYATYRATAWAKAEFDEGAAHALYAYQWDSYIWAFTASTAMPNGEDWRQFTVTFRVPQDQVILHPLAIYDAVRAEAWVDDMVVEKVSTPEETIAALEAQASVQGDDARLLGRWYAEHGAFEKACAVMEGTSDWRVKADIACVIAKATDDAELRERMLVVMLACGAPSMNAGTERLWEVASLVQPDQPFGVVVALLPAHAGDAAVLDSIAALVSACRRRDRGRIPSTVAVRKAQQMSFQQALEEVAAALGDGAQQNTAYQKLAAEGREWEAEVAAEIEALGDCDITIGGRTLSGESHAIVLAMDPTPQEETAARDLQMHLERITGHEIPIVSETERGDRACLSVGRNPFTDSLGVRIDYEALGVEGVRIVTKGPHVALTGNKRGVLYATYVFLEEHLGCRWFTADCATWPTEGDINIGDLDITYVPPFEYRDTDYPKCRAPEFGVRNRLNGKYAQAKEEWGGKVDYRGFVHTFHNLVPPEQYFAEHPEYFSEIAGQRTTERAQLCLTNPDVLRIATETVKRWIEESPDASIISVSQNDCRGYCQCASCTALAEKEGSQSGPLLHFVNGIADAIAEEHPDIIIDTLAYQYTRKPPKHVRPRPNVAIRLCSIECEFNRPLATSAFNAPFVDDIIGWDAICDRLHIWDYVINYAHCVQPFPNFYVLQPNIKFFHEHGVTGIYEEANYFSRGGEFAELRTYVMAKLLWDPDYDVDTAIDEFCQAYYGKAWHLVRSYIDDTHRLAVSDPDYHMPIYTGQNAPFQTDEAIAFYRDLFDRAEALVEDDPVLLHRVQVARLPIIYTQLMRGAASLYTLTGDSLAPLSSAVDAAGLCERFETIARRERLTHLSEGRGPEDLLDSWLELVNRPVETLPVVRLQSGSLETVIVPGLGGRILSLKAGGEEVMLVVERKGGVEPRTGGYKEFSEFGYRSPGWIEPYAVIERGARFVVVEAALSNGFTLRRRYELDAERAVLRVASTLTNTTDAAKSTQLRVHPCFRLDEAAGATLRVGAGAEAVTVALDKGAERECELTYPALEMAGSEWAFTDGVGGRTVVSRFKQGQVGTCYFNWNGPQHRANLELWTPPTELAPGGSLTLEHEYEFSDG